MRKRRGWWRERERKYPRFLPMFSQRLKIKKLFVEKREEKCLSFKIKVSFDNLEQKEVWVSRNESNLSLIFDKICILFFICSEETHMNASLRDLLELDHICSRENIQRLFVYIDQQCKIKIYRAANIL